MNLFINDIPITLYDGTTKPLSKRVYDHILDVTHQSAVAFEPTHRVWIRNPTMAYVASLLRDLDSRSMAPPDSIDITTQDYQGIKQHIQKQFRVVSAAGGLVLKKDKVLLIYRFQKWDLPKGKKELGETPIQTAKREIEEECNITVTPLKKICTTWHSYEENEDKILKDTHWYTVRLLDDSKIQPCQEEGIEDIRWITSTEAQQMLKNSYRSIRFVFKKYCEQTVKEEE